MAKYDKSDLERRMKGAVESLRGDLAGLRTGRANTALLDPVMVEAYGQRTPLNQVANTILAARAGTTAATEVAQNSPVRAERWVCP